MPHVWATEGIKKHWFVVQEAFLDLLKITIICGPWPTEEEVLMWFVCCFPAQREKNVHFPKVDLLRKFKHDENIFSWVQKCWLLFLCKLFSPCKENPNMFELWAISDILSFLCLSWDVTNDNYQLLIHVTLLLWRSLPPRRRLSSTGLWTFPLCCRPTCMEETSWPITRMMRREAVGSPPFSECLKACGSQFGVPAWFPCYYLSCSSKQNPSLQAEMALNFRFLCISLLSAGIIIGVRHCAPYSIREPAHTNDCIYEHPQLFHIVTA